MDQIKHSTADELLEALAGRIQEYLNPPVIEEADRPPAATLAETKRPGTALSVPEVTDAPWRGLSGSGPGMNVAPSAELYAKMRWLAQNLPG